MIIRALTIFFALLALSFIESSFFSALDSPVHAVPIVFIFGVLLYQLSSPAVGLCWLFFGGMLLDLSTPNFVPSVWTFSLAGMVGIVLCRRVFANHSLYALVGLGASMWALNTLLEIIWLSVRQITTGHALPLTYYSAAFWNDMAIFLVALLLVSTLTRQVSLRLRRQFLLRQS